MTIPNNPPPIQLTPQQQAIVRHDHGPALVFAVAGAGKTTAMVHRIEWLVREQQFAPANILATSFGRSNVEDLRQALRQWPICQSVDVRTLHSLGREVIKTAQQLGYVPQLKVNNGRNADSSDNLSDHQLLNRAVAQARQDNLPFKRELEGLERQDFLDYVSSCKGNLQYANLAQAKLPLNGRHLAKQARPPDDELAWYLDLYQLYERVRLAQGAITFDDMLLTGWELLITYPDVLTHTQARYQCVMVDEFQDINHAQAEILELITQPHRNYMAIGDDDQTVYEWRGAAPRFILDFAQQYQAQTYLMDENFRCPVGPLTLANEVIRHNKKRQPKRLHLTRGFGGEAQLAFVPSLAQMATEIVERVQRLHKSGVSLDEMAILVRLNAQTPSLEQALIARQIPYRSQSPFYERHEIQTLLHYGRFAWVEKRLRNKELLTEAMMARALDAWQEIANRPKRYITQELRQRMAHVMRRGNQPLSQVIGAFSQTVTEEWVRNNLQQLADDVYWLAENLEQDASKTLQQLEMRLDYKQFLRKTSGFAQTGSDRAAGVEALIAYAAGQGTLQAFLAHVTSLAQQRVGKGEGTTAVTNQAIPAVTISTIHRAKGLEWPHIFIPQCNQGTLPFTSQEPMNPINIEEERRLFYVALTRARQTAYLYALDATPLSQFLNEARWRQTITAVQEVQAILRQPPASLTAPTALALARHSAAYVWHSYLENWWDAPLDGQTAVKQQMVNFVTAVRQRNVQQTLGLTDKALDFWLKLGGTLSPSPEGFSDLETLLAAQKPLSNKPRSAQSKTSSPRSKPSSPTPTAPPPDVLRPGLWVQCDAGWGRIEGIADQVGRPLAQAVASDKSLRLTVTLRPDEDAVRVLLDLSAATITFLQAEKVYSCIICHCFSAVDTQTLTQHNKLAHDDRLAFRTEKGPQCKLTGAVYAEERPLATTKRYMGRK